MKDYKIYGIDLDGICFNFVDPFRMWLNDHLHCNLEQEEITSYYWYETTDVSKEDFMREFDNFGMNGGYRNLPVLPGTLEALGAIISDGNKIVYITNRPEYAKADTVDALREHNFPHREFLYFAKGDKSPLIKELGVDVFIDDSPRTIADITVNTRTSVYCRNYKYNEHLDDAFFTRVRGWEDFLEAEGLVIKNG